MEVLLDSVILIDHFNGIAAATEYLTQVNEGAAISVITRAEVPASDPNGAYFTTFGDFDALGCKAT